MSVTPFTLKDLTQAFYLANHKGREGVPLVDVKLGEDTVTLSFRRKADGVFKRFLDWLKGILNA